MISVIIPAWNEEEEIESAVASLSPRSECEVILVDGGSTDRTIERARPCVDLVLSSPHGRGRQMNAGARGSRGEILLFLHADTRLAPGALAAVERAVREGASFGAFRYALRGGGLLAGLLTYGTRLRSEGLGLPYGDQGLWIRRKVFETLGGYAEDDRAEDLDLLLRLRRDYARPRILPLPAATSIRSYARHGFLRTLGTHQRILLSALAGGIPARPTWR